jgi:hypothetical protein
MEAVKATSIQGNELQPQQKLMKIKHKLLYKAINDRGRVYAAYYA